MIGAGLIIKFQGHTGKKKLLRSRLVQAAGAAPPPPPPPPPPSMAFTCGTNVANVPLGQMVVITGDAKTEPGQQDLDYSWSSTGGRSKASGNVVSINTTGMAIGDYRVKGHAALSSSPSIGRGLRCGLQGGSSRSTAGFRLLRIVDMRKERKRTSTIT